ncbi:hypothetical protein CMI43_00900 [Candidatus Pacearchaeota archaeon]|jgi:hypothetical protein|nr:hypothetical protein [Candidatus Pacearchaeota archaeon]|tara:strand:- start:77 stop:316 length:240 start_codon:yes stop_codon:yes gene_type:complete
MVVLIYIIIILLAIPTGLFLAKLCEEELNDWKLRFKIMIIISFILSIGIYFSSLEYKISIMVSLLFIIMTLLTLIKKTL